MAQQFRRLIDAARQEAGAALRLADCLRQARRAVEAANPAGLEAELIRAQDLAAALSRAATVRERHVRASGAGKGLGQRPTFGQVIRTTGGRDGRAEVRRLAEALEAVGREARCLAACCRFGAAMTAHLAGLARPLSAYGPLGRPEPAGLGAGRRA